MMMQHPAINTTLFTLISLLAVAGCSDRKTAEAEKTNPLESNEMASVRVTEYKLNAEKGRKLFVSRGCVRCHSVNGVGGRAAFPLDAETFLTEIDALQFASRMWRGAPEMIRLQEIELGYQIDVSSQDIADLAAFAGDPEEQRKFTLEQVPEALANDFLNEYKWKTDE